MGLGGEGEAPTVHLEGRGPLNLDPFVPRILIPHLTKKQYRHQPYRIIIDIVFLWQADIA